MFSRKLTLLMSLMAAVMIGVLGFGSAAAAQTPTPIAPTSPTPQNALLAFYNNINLANYTAAYAYWTNPGQSFQDFSNGYASTDHVDAYLGALQSGATTGALPVVLVSYNKNGSRSWYWGCYQLQQGISAATPWSIISADIRTMPMQQNSIPDATTLNAYLNINCAQPSTWNVNASYTPWPVDSAADAETMLRTYYSIINKKDYAAAYAQWLQPIPGPKPNGQPAEDYRLSYPSFVSGYTDTAYVDTYLGSYNETGGSAGHGYLNGLMPAVLVGQHTDGTVVAYYGCYVVGGLPSGQLGIVSGSFVHFSNDVPTGQQILQYLQIDCSTLPLQY